MSTPAVELSSLYTHIIHPCYHRNHNQHRVAKWWKSFCMLRRHTKKLIFELEDLERDEKFADGKENRFVIKSRERVEEHAEWLGGWIEGRCYQAFSTVVADGQYANLGLMLMGMLAQIRAIVQSLRPEPVFEEAFAGGEPHENLNVEGEFDYGEVVRREDILRIKDRNTSEEDKDEVQLMPIQSKTKKGSTKKNASKKDRVVDRDSTKVRKKKMRRAEE